MCHSDCTDSSIIALDPSLPSIHDLAVDRRPDRTNEWIRQTASATPFRIHPYMHTTIRVHVVMQPSTSCMRPGRSINKRRFIISNRSNSIAVETGNISLNYICHRPRPRSRLHNYCLGSVAMSSVCTCLPRRD